MPVGMQPPRVVGADPVPEQKPEPEKKQDEKPVEKKKDK